MIGLRNLVRIGVGLALVVGLFALWIGGKSGGHDAHHVDAAAGHPDLPFIASPPPLDMDAPRVVVDVDVANFQFSPSDISIAAGSTVHWIWGPGSGLHSATSGTCDPDCTPSGVFNSNTKGPGSTYDFTFNVPGSYPYYCIVHGAAMTGSVTVTPSTAAGVTISGRVVASEGRGIRDAVVTISDGAGIQRRTVTDRRGFYTFADVEPGRTYVMTAAQRRYQFEPRIVAVVDNVGNIDFVASAEPQPRRPGTPNKDN
jgi:plastocyanin